MCRAAFFPSLVPRLISRRMRVWVSGLWDCAIPSVTSRYLRSFADVTNYPKRGPTKSNRLLYVLENAAAVRCLADAGCCVRVKIRHEDGMHIRITNTFTAIETDSMLSEQQLACRVLLLQAVRALTTAARTAYGTRKVDQLFEVDS